MAQTGETVNEIIVLCEGYSRYADGEHPGGADGEEGSEAAAAGDVMLANCTCTLIKGPDCNVIVDTMTPWDGDLLLRRKKDENRKKQKIQQSIFHHADGTGGESLCWVAEERRFIFTSFQGLKDSPSKKGAWSNNKNSLSKGAMSAMVQSTTPRSSIDPRRPRFRHLADRHD
uniref:Uncharacterized protein n=1 Tax=Anopheles atroparvus TaxID=41427 RepID=A0AAG5DDT0_ANOAO